MVGSGRMDARRVGELPGLSRPSWEQGPLKLLKPRGRRLAEAPIHRVGTAAPLRGADQPSDKWKTDLVEGARITECPDQSRQRILNEQTCLRASALSPRQRRFNRNCLAPLRIPGRVTLK